MERKNLALLCAGVVCFWLFALAFGTAQGSGLRRQSPAVQTAVQPQGPVQLTAEPPALELPCRAACLIDQQTGTVLYEKNMHQALYPASITKLMTALLAVQSLEPEQVLTVSQTAVNAVPRSSSHISLLPGEQLTAEQALYAIGMESANDAANVLAEAVAGSLAAFAEQMTEAAQALGATYLTAGHVFETTCKAGLPGRGLDFFRRVCAAVSGFTDFAHMATGCPRGIFCPFGIAADLVMLRVAFAQAARVRRKRGGLSVHRKRRRRQQRQHHAA